MKNYYKILEVNENASQEIIEKAYKVLAKKYHPDLQNINNVYWAENNFKQITEAYDILSDPEKREKYDLDLGVSVTSPDFYQKYDDLYNEKENLKKELGQMKIKKESEDYVKSKDKENKFTYVSLFSDSIKSLGNLIKEGANQPKEEKKKTLMAILLTVLIIGILLLIAFNIPAVKEYLFPFL